MNDTPLTPEQRIEAARAAALARRREALDTIAASFDSAGNLIASTESATRFSLEQAAALIARRVGLEIADDDYECTCGRDRFGGHDIDESALHAAAWRLSRGEIADALHELDKALPEPLGGDWARRITPLLRS